jgi:hypothetical protein
MGEVGGKTGTFNSARRATQAAAPWLNRLNRLICKSKSVIVNHLLIISQAISSFAKTSIPTTITQRS